MAIPRGVDTSFTGISSTGTPTFNRATRYENIYRFSPGFTEGAISNAAAAEQLRGHVATPTPTRTSVATRGTTSLGPGGVRSPYLAVGAPSRYTTPSRTTTGRLGSREGFVARRKPAPEYPTEELRGISYPGFEPPGLEIPERDPERVTALTERAFRPGALRLRTGTRRALRIAEDAPTPYARRIQARDVLAGFGEGLGRVRESATRTGLAEYEPEFRSGVEKVKGEYEAGYRGAVVRHGTEVSRRAQQRQDIMNQYMANLKQWQARIGG